MSGSTALISGRSLVANLKRWRSWFQTPAVVAARLVLPVQLARPDPRALAEGLREPPDHLAQPERQDPQDLPELGRLAQRDQLGRQARQVPQDQRELPGHLARSRRLPQALRKQ